MNQCKYCGRELTLTSEVNGVCYACADTNIVTNGDFSNKKVKLDEEHYAEQTITDWNTCIWEVKKGKIE